ncbi:uncharacterized protein [Montipora capricornis]|uniref:uncharacterized protein n=1 Tax=Montipora capricornis TaxID=246305 RepID=UPI0035F1164C
MQAKWAEDSGKLLEAGIDPTFSHLTDFIEKRALVANTEFGKLVGFKLGESRVSKHLRKCADGDVTVLALSQVVGNQANAANVSRSKRTSLTDGQIKCKCCDGRHELEKCFKFRDKRYAQRKDFVRKQNLCENCLKLNHVARRCRSLGALELACLVAVEKGTIPCFIYLLDCVWSVDKLPVPNESISSTGDICDWPHLQGISIPKLDQEVSILIGNDVPKAHWVFEERHGHSKQPCAARRLLGWTIIGPVGGTSSSEVNVSFVCGGQETLSVQIERMYNAEFRESLATSHEMMSIEVKRALAIMERTVRMVNGHHQLSLPWKHDSSCLPNNRSMAESRLNLLKRGLEKGKDLRVKCKVAVEDDIAQGRARSCARFHNTSLNEQLLQGPDFTNSLIGILLRFRQERIGLMADIEKMFHQVRVSPQDTCTLSFLWWPGGDLSKKAEEHRMLEHLFGAKSSPSFASFSLKKTAENNKRDLDVEAIGDFSTASRDKYTRR